MAVVHPLLPLIAVAAKAVVDFVITKVVDMFSETTLTTWMIWHTAIMGSAQVPISVFTLSNSDWGAPGLCRVAQGLNGQPIADNDYQYKPFLERRARFMIGGSSMTPHQFDDRYLALVAASGRPLAWQEPLETNSGLRLLLPHLDRQHASNRAGLVEDPHSQLAAKSKASYISAIRAEIHPEPRTSIETPPPIKRRTKGKSSSFEV